jgi:hypothetical protein
VIVTIEAAARAAYIAFCAECAGLDPRGNPLPCWDQLTELEQRSWQRAARRAAEFIATAH